MTDFRFELLVLPVTDVDRSKEFYVDKMGWHCDVDHDMGEAFRVVQLTPPGSACSVTIGRGMSDPSAAGLYKGMHLCVEDIVVARDELVGRSVDVGEPYHFGAAGQAAGVHPDRARYGTFAEILDPDGNLWLTAGGQRQPHRRATKGLVRHAMTTFVLLPGAGGSSWYWSRVVPLLRAGGHDAIAVDFPGADETAGLPEYTDLVVNAIGDREDVVLVAQSLGGFTAPMVCARVPVNALVLVNAMIPASGETPGAWWDNVGAVTARETAAEAENYPSDFDPFTYFLHDVAPEIAAEGEEHQGGEADAVFASTCEFESWPADTRVLTGADDRFFPLEFQLRVARERLGIEPDVLPGGHLIALARPETVAGYLLGP